MSARTNPPPPTTGRRGRRVSSAEPTTRFAGLPSLDRREDRPTTGELIALRWRDIDFPGQAIRVRANFSYGELVTPKSGKVRSVPMVPEVAQALARLSQREHFTADHDPVFTGTVGGHLDASALRRRYARAAKRAGLRPLPFHSLRHYFGSMAVNRASLVQVQSWMGHSEIQTTARYLHAKSQAQDAAILASAFARPAPDQPAADLEPKE
jgi:integrase